MCTNSLLVHVIFMYMYVECECGRMCARAVMYLCVHVLLVGLCMCTHAYVGM